MPLDKASLSGHFVDVKKVRVILLAILAIGMVSVGALLAFPHRVFSLLEYMRKEKVLTGLNELGSSCREIHLDRWGHVMKDTPLNSEPLDKDLFFKWLGALSSDGSVPTSVTKCWDPHHAIRFTFADGKEAKLEICFGCDKFYTEHSGRRKIPMDWREPFREVFRMHGIPDKTPSTEEMRKLLEAESQ